MEQGKFEPTEEGSAQGSVMSPMLANIYMHHVLTLWFKLWCNGPAYIAELYRGKR